MRSAEKPFDLQLTPIIRVLSLLFIDQKYIIFIVIHLGLGKIFSKDKESLFNFNF